MTKGPILNSDVRVIEPGRSGFHYWHDLWSYRELFFFLAWRDILVTYKQTTIGIAEDHRLPQSLRRARLSLPSGKTLIYGSA